MRVRANKGVWVEHAVIVEDNTGKILKVNLERRERTETERGRGRGRGREGEEEREGRGRGREERRGGKTVCYKVVKAITITPIILHAYV